MFIIGPIERVAIPVDKDGNIKTFGFVTYKHLSSVNYALNLFTGTKLFGRELTLKNRNSNRTREQPMYNNQQSTPPMSLVHGYNNLSPFPNAMGDLSPIQLQTAHQQQIIQQQLVLMATGQNLMNAGSMMFGGSSSLEQFASTRGDASGSQREHYVDRNRYHREENRTSRSKPYRRSRSRSPQQRPSRRSRERSPASNRNRHHDKGRNSDERSNYHRWGKR